KAARNQVVSRGRVFRQSVMAAFDLDQLVRLHQRVEPLLELLTLAAAQPQFANELLVAGRAVRLALNAFENHSISKHSGGPKFRMRASSSQLCVRFALACGAECQT